MLKEQVAQHVLDFGRSQVWALMKDFIRLRLDESVNLLRAKENTREQDMFYKGQAEEAEFFLDLPKQVAEFILSGEQELNEEEKGE